MVAVLESINNKREKRFKKFMPCWSWTRTSTANADDERWSNVRCCNSPLKMRNKTKQPNRIQLQIATNIVSWSPYTSKQQSSHSKIAPFITNIRQSEGTTTWRKSCTTRITMFRRKDISSTTSTNNNHKKNNKNDDKKGKGIRRRLRNPNNNNNNGTTNDNKIALLLLSDRPNNTLTTSASSSSPAAASFQEITIDPSIHGTVQDVLIQACNNNNGSAATNTSKKSKKKKLLRTSKSAPPPAAAERKGKNKNTNATTTTTSSDDNNKLSYQAVLDCNGRIHQGNVPLDAAVLESISMNNDDNNNNNRDATQPSFSSSVSSYRIVWVPLPAHENNNNNKNSSNDPSSSTVGLAEKYAAQARERLLQHDSAIYHQVRSFRLRLRRCCCRCRLEQQVIFSMWYSSRFLRSYKPRDTMWKHGCVQRY